MRELRARARRRADLQIVGIFLIVFVVLSFMTSQTAGALDLMLDRAAITGLVALGLTVVIVQAQLDLSVGSTMALAAIVTVEVSDRSLALGIVAALGVGLAVGLLNGFIVTVMQVNSFIATLGTMVAIRGVALLVTNSEPVQGGSIDAALTLIKEVFWIFTPKILVLVGALVLIHLMLSRSRTGREFYAVGGNMEAARAAGVPVRRRVVQGFVICGVLSSAAGWVTATELNSANPNMAADVALLAIAAVVVGGASLTGGRGTALGTALGAATVALIATVLDLEGISSGYQAIATGLILLLVVAADQLSLAADLGRRLHTRLRPGEPA